MRSCFLWWDNPLATPQFSKQRSSLIGSCHWGAVKELLSSLLSLGNLGICSAAFGNCKPKKEEASYRNWTCILLIMVLLPLGCTKNTLWTGFSNNYFCLYRGGLAYLSSMSPFLLHLLWLHCCGVECYVILGTSKQFRGHTGNFGKASWAEVLWLRAPFQASN